MMWETKKPKLTTTDADHFTVLGKDVTFKGVVHFHGTVQLDSYFEGEIHTSGVLVVGEHAVIRGTITVGTLISSGTIHGAVRATHKVQLLKSAVQLGDVLSPLFSIEDGAYFRGYTDMGPRQTAEAPTQDFTALPEQPGWTENQTLPLPGQEPVPLAYDQVQDAVIQRASVR